MQHPQGWKEQAAMTKAEMLEEARQWVKEIWACPMCGLEMESYYPAPGLLACFHCGLTKNLTTQKARAIRKGGRNRVK
jgi:hypothetical protein